eukprot:TRINITY_DN119_c0_g1_i5.p2 TRINITY_DN119_c0_g1~~TRINITY_DN119_c0_g1_i5.p2  ORF type:complete len:118 (-),score=51.29 TRINITY_DN119_c0_g1_i5:1119-1472(-)
MSQRQTTRGRQEQQLQLQQQQQQKKTTTTTVIHLEDKGDVDVNLVQEANAEFKQLSEELTTIKEMTKDLSDIVQSSGEVLVESEDNVIKANINVVHSVQELKEAEKLAPCCCCCVVS